MPNLHLTKVAFACRDVDALRQRISRRASDGELRVATRMRPKRAAELIGGYLYWIVKHRLIARQEILRFEDRQDGRIDIVCSAELLAVTPRHCRAHQGWRYLEDDDAPSADDDGSGLGQLPPQLYGRLAALALV
ncbi:DUF1489 family protein [Sphingomonas hankyongi]|uniref:DUF1489 domain-containing protein n=1 Tax=Sphingomonas hankyongi TaxID=2908209 RepID=A0ABT0S4F0_9SPHN|nr:DUF1489 domain-containing protein [Sphingomonas hankyongi]